MLEKKTKASKDQLKKYNLMDNKDQVFVIQLFKVIEERCDELDNQLDDQNYEIIHREYKRVATSIYDYEVFFIES